MAHEQVHPEQKAEKNTYTKGDFFRGKNGSLVQLVNVDRKGDQPIVTLVENSTENKMLASDFDEAFIKLHFYAGQKVRMKRGTFKGKLVCIQRDAPEGNDDKISVVLVDDPRKSREYALSYLSTNVYRDVESDSERKKTEIVNTNPLSENEKQDTPPLELTPEMEITREQELELEVAKLREEFVEHDLKHQGTWNKLKGILGIGSNHTETDEYQEKKEAYTQMLQALQEKRFAVLQKELKGKGLAVRRELLEKHLRYFGIDERIKLYEAATNVRAEQEEKDGWFSYATFAREKVKSLVDGYKTLSWKQKLVISGALAGATFLTAGTASGTAVAVAGAVAAKRALAAAVLFTTAEAGANKFLDRREKEKAERELQEAVTEIIALENLNRGITERGERAESSDGRYTQVSRLLNKEISDIDQKFQVKKQRVSRVKAGSFVLALGMAPSVVHALEGAFSLGSDAVEVPDHEPSTSIEDTPREVYHAQSGEHSILRSTDISEKDLSHGVYHQPVPQEPSEITPSVNVGSESVTEISPGVVTVTAADSARGLWGILEKQLPEGLPDTERIRIVTSLENHISNQFAGMSDAQIQELGFQNRDINLIYPGDKLKLSELISKDQWERILGGESVTLHPGVQVPAEDLQGAVSEAATTETSATPEVSAEAAGSAPEHFSEQVTSPPDHRVQRELLQGTRSGSPGLLQYSVADSTLSQDVLSPENALSEVEINDQGIAIYSLAESNPKEFLQEYPESKLAFQANLRDLGTELTTVERYGPVSNWSHDMLLNRYADQKVLTVINQYDQNHWRIEHGRAPTYLGLPRYLGPRGLEPPDPYAVDQQRRVLEGGFLGNIRSMTETAFQRFGRVGVPQPDENVKHYMQRLTTLITREQMRNPEFKFNF